MVITWDEPKRQKVLQERGLDFASVTRAFLAAAILVAERDGRRLVVGRLEGHVVAVVIAPLGTEAVAIVTMRSASKAERKLL